MKDKNTEMNYESVAAEVVEKSGGAKNIKTVAHCATRLRFTLADKNAADMDAIKKIPGVLGCIYATEQLQIVFGKNVLGVYNAVLKDSSFADAGEVQPAPTDGKDRQPLTVRSVFDAVIGFIAGSVAHLVPGLIAGGMLKVFLLLITYAVPSFAETDTYTILGWVANAPFYFMPGRVVIITLFSISCPASRHCPNATRTRPMITEWTVINFFPFWNRGTL